MEIINTVAATMHYRAHKAAISLAAGHGHLWANTWPAQAIACADYLDSATIAELLARAQAEAETHNRTTRPTGIEVAHALVDGPVTGPMYVHSTGTGRLRWEVFPAPSGDPQDWVLKLELHRPAMRLGDREWAAGAVMTAQYRADEDKWEVFHGMGAPFYPRHVEIFSGALRLVAAEHICGPVPEGALRVLRDAAYRHAYDIAASKAAEFKAQFGAVAAASLEAIFAELGDEAPIVRQYL